MATILELARHAGVSTETVLRVILREPVNENARKQVGAAIEALGMPAYPRPDGHVEVLPDEAPPSQSVELVQPESAAPIVAELRDLFGELLERVDRERRERVDDVALTTDLMIEGWRNVDRRLGRLEKVIERLSNAQYFGNGNGNGNGNGIGNGSRTPAERRIQLP